MSGRGGGWRGFTAMALLAAPGWACGSGSGAGDEGDMATDTEGARGTGSPTLASTSDGGDVGGAAHGSLDGQGSGAHGGSGGEGSSSGGADEGDAEPFCDRAEVPVFAEVAAEAGVDFLHGPPNSPPSCLVGSITTPGVVCLPERMTGAAAVGDYDGDGWPDLFVSRLEGGPLAFHNEGDGTFAEVSAALGIAVPGATAGAAWADIENDGDLDLYVLTMAGDRYYLFVNDGNGSFTEEAQARGLALETGHVHLGTSVAVGDYDLDGYVDLYVGEWRDYSVVGDFPVHARLLHNRGALAPGAFEDVTTLAGVDVQDLSALVDGRVGVWVFAPAFVDLDADGWPELTLVSDFGHSRLFWNEGDGTFSDGTEAAGVGLDSSGMGSTFGDFDRDGDLDWFVTNIADDLPSDQNRLYENLGDRTFAEIADVAGAKATGMAWGTVFADFNLDADLDLVVANGFYSSGHLAESTYLLTNVGALPFVDATETAQIGVDATQGRGLVTFDYDLDGDLDVFIVNNAGHPELWRNEGLSGKHWLRVDAIGTSSNAEGLGARVEVTTTRGEAPQVHILGATTSHFLGQGEPVAHFGLGCDVELVDEIVVRWPGSGAEQTFRSIPPDSTILAIEPP